MPNLVNQMVVRELTHEFQDAEGLIAVSFGGLTVKRTEQLRGQLAEKGVRFRMVRNSLARRVLADRGITLEKGALKGNTGIAYGDPESIIGAAKIFADKQVKKEKLVQFKGAFLDGESLDARGAEAIADLPDRNTANAQLLGVLSAPARSIAVLLAGIPSQTVRVIQGRVDKGAE
ncbi:MAG: 50S ribosomal protein L10 [Planctomycetes bacterium]|nr:50S ribosomal protein L10 [Planctomycetota bacterium]MCB9910354.1 50S ribosomal protein L10 [Planctomycetota bacterium]MCB9912035.1 50S ribosomal protein L10 [Planctomycetota bacterium]HRV81022.1 50S ribosomal protein L10 [Planctomycetota bacterium]